MLKPLRESFLFRQNLIGKSVSRNQFEGDPIVIRHEERITVEKAQNVEKLNNHNRQSQGKEMSAVVAERTYLIMQKFTTQTRRDIYWTEANITY